MHWGDRLSGRRELRIMILKFIRLIVAATSILLPLHGGASPQGAPAPAAKPLPFVSPLFGDNMVLQRGKTNALWGWSEPGDHIQIAIGEQTASAVAAADRRWQAQIQPPPAGGPYVVKEGSHANIAASATSRKAEPNPRPMAPISDTEQAPLTGTTEPRRQSQEGAPNSFVTDQSLDDVILAYLSQGERKR